MKNILEKYPTRKLQDEEEKGPLYKVGDRVDYTAQFTPISRTGLIAHYYFQEHLREWLYLITFEREAIVNIVRESKISGLNQRRR